MKYVKLFLASSIVEMKTERLDIGNFIRALNNICIESGVYFKLTMCEDIPDDMAATRKQEVYNDIIRDCDYFYIMVGNKLGDGTLEEYKVAKAAFDNNRSKPKITVFFTDSSSAVAASVADFKKSLEGIEHYYSIVPSIDTIKMKVLMQMITNGEFKPDLILQDAKLFLDGHVLGAVDFEQLPFYHLNCGLSEYRKKLNELDNKIDDLTGSGRSSELDECKKERCDIKKAIHEIEKTILRTSIEIFSRENDGTHINRRTRTARELFEAGKLDEAIAVLSDGEREEDYGRFCEKQNIPGQGFETILNEIICKINLLKNKPMTDELYRDIVGYYKDAFKKIRQHNLDPQCGIDFMRFLRDRKDYKYAKEVGFRLHCYLLSRDPEDLDNSLKAKFWTDYGILCREDEEIDKAEQLLLEAYEIRKDQAEQDPVLFSYDFAYTCNSLGILFRIKDEINKAKNFYTEGLNALRELSGSNPLRYGDLRANICNNLGYLFLRIRDYSRAEALFLEAFDIRSQLNDNHPDEHLIYLGRINNNLGELYYSMGKLDKAEENIICGLNHRRRCTESNPYMNVYEAGSYFSLATLYTLKGQYKEAEELFLQAISLYKNHIDANANYFKAKCAYAKAGLGDLYRRMKRFGEAKCEILEALDIYRELVKDTNGKHRAECARICIDAGLLFSETDLHQDAGKYFCEAYSLIHAEARENTVLYGDLETCALYNYAVALNRTGKIEQSKNKLSTLKKKIEHNKGLDPEYTIISQKISSETPLLPDEYVTLQTPRLFSV